MEIKDENGRHINFPDNSFDVVHSMFCLHNVEGKEEQDKACLEIAWV